MKRILPFVITFIFAATLAFSGCGEADRSSELREFMSSHEDAYSETFTEETCAFSDAAEYIKSWAEANSIDIIYEGKHSIVLTNKATKGYDKEPSTTMLCSFDTQDAISNKELISTAQAVLLGPVEHGNISLAVTECCGDQLTGIEELPLKYLSCDSLINLKTGNNNTILTSGPVASTNIFRKSGKMTESTYAQAFEIKMKMPEYTDPFDFIKGNNYPDPISTVGGFLATCKSSGRLFDIASFESKANGDYTPYFAKAVVVVDANHIESFRSKFDKSYENMEDRFSDLDAEFKYTLTETDMPEKVLSDDIADNLISLMYTMNTGVCQQDEDSGLIYVASYIRSISTKDGDLSLVIGTRARGESYLDSMSAEYETTAGLCSTKYKYKKAGRLWKSDARSDLVTYFTGCVPPQEQVESAVSLRIYENDIIAASYPDQNMIIYSFEKGDRKTVLENMIAFLDPAIQK